jgi:glycosyltransferase involved in cell wall biosynthesis
VTPRVSIGMPVFNRASTVGRALESALTQTFADFELLISDNASSDGSDVVCQRYTSDPRIRYTRQLVNIGEFANFRFVLEAARAPYFMWLAADDYVRPQLLEQAVPVLDTRPDVVCVAPRTEFLDADGNTSAAAGTFPLLGDTRDNLCRYLFDPSDNSRFYGLYRRNEVRRVLPEETCYGFDWVIAARTLLYGKHEELPEVLLVREASDRLKYIRMIETLAPGRLDRLLPLRRFTLAVLAYSRVTLHPRVLGALLRLNLVHHLLYCRHRYPRYGRFAYHMGARLKSVGTILRCGLRRPLVS